jgi:hypothetical protein
VTHTHHCGFNAYQFDPVTTLLLMLFQPWLYPFRNHRLGVSRWQAIGWRLPLGVSHWLPHRPFAQESRQSHYLTASFSPHPLWLCLFSLSLHLYIHVIHLSVALWTKRTKWNHMTKSCETFCKQWTADHHRLLVVFFLPITWSYAIYANTFPLLGYSFTHLLFFIYINSFSFLLRLTSG